MKPFFLTLIAGLFVVTGCKTSRTDINNSSDFVIKSGFACGWGSGEDSIKISRTTVSYKYYIPTKAASAQITKSRAISTEEWTEISNAVDMDVFTKLNYNTCNICADGCDEWIEIEDNTRSHKITFNKSARINSVNDLQSKLQGLRAEFNPNL